MTKQEILAELTNSGQVSAFRRSPGWDKAFNEYNAVNKPKLSQGCTSCYKKVLAWLRS